MNTYSPTRLLVLAGAVALASFARAADPDAAALLRGYNAAGLQLFRAAWPADANAVCSPYSIGAAMTMALAGAKGGTEAEIARALGAAGVLERLDAAQRGARAELLRAAGTPGVQLRIANGLALAEHGDLIAPAFRERVRDAWDAEIFAAPEPGDVNAWVGRKTEGRIPELIRRYPPNCVALLLNAVWFKGLWEKPFDARATRPGPFTLASGERIEAPTMRQSAEFAVVRDATWEAIALPYAGGNLAMVVLLPAPGRTLAETEKALDARALEIILATLRDTTPRKVRLSMPRFRLTAGAGLVPAFKGLGVAHAFSPETADFGGLVGRESAPGLVWIADILHKAFIEVNEEGSEAAAATAVVIQTRGIAREETFAVDRPALFLIMDRPAGAILFLGRLADPR